MEIITHSTTLMRRKSNTVGDKKVSNGNQMKILKKPAKTFVGNNKTFVAPRSKIKKTPTDRSFGSIAQITSLKSKGLKRRTMFQKIPKATMENTLQDSKNNYKPPMKSVGASADVAPGKFKDFKNTPATKSIGKTAQRDGKNIWKKLSIDDFFGPANKVILPKSKIVETAPTNTSIEAAWKTTLATSENLKEGPVAKSVGKTGENNWQKSGAWKKISKDDILRRTEKEMEIDNGKGDMN